MSGRDKLGAALIVTLLGAPGVGILVAGLIKARAQYEFLSNATATQGRVVSVQLLHENDESRFYGVTVEHQVKAGPPRRFTIETNVPASFPEGRVVGVLYRDDRPNEGRIQDFGLMWRDILLFCLAGAAWSGFAVFMLYVTLRAGRTP